MPSDDEGSSTQPSIPMQDNIFLEDISKVILPPFWVHQPDLWFKYIESQFFIHKINSEKSKFHLSVAHLPADIFAKVYDIISDPLESNAFSVLKETIINSLSLSEEKILDKLLSKAEMGDRKPSDVYRELKRFLGDSIINEIFLLKIC